MHVNSTTEEKEIVTRQKSKLGVRLFFVYLICYAGFVALGVFNYELLSTTVFSGLNLAVVYGIGLIVFAVIMGIIYNYYCTKYEDDAERADKLTKEDTNDL
ncbi:DUF485 domain-containing protein [Pedobacter xixiisoli]|uniref:Uncharacterized protein n=1 Tax=Pedobacter xixiisoli TaxID=1476464 RepID=A0A285ZZ65_9SPHI|nr:DUF485 domain-containing protein [Pedobacter xixiisoli]SOD14949.1 Protein of unknown function, DUF485 [Pedobacter xixiisoli]